MVNKDLPVELYKMSANKFEKKTLVYDTRDLEKHGVGAKYKNGFSSFGGALNKHHSKAKLR